jgi:type II secretion system protein D
MSTRMHTLSRRRSIAHLALICGAAAGLASLSIPRPALADPSDDGPDDSASLWWQLSMLSDDELAALMDGPDAPMQPADQTPDASKQPAAQPADADATPKAAPSAEAKTDPRGRRVQPDEPTELAFKNVSMEQVIPFIVEATGKVVLPMPDVMSTRITILNDRKIPRAKALDMVFLALLQNGVAVVESDDLIQLRSLTEIDRQQVTVIGPDESVLGRSDIGAIYEKVFAPRYASVANISDMVKNSLPNYAKMTMDVDSNRILVMGDIGLLQRIEEKIRAVDVQSTATLVTETFVLHFADPNEIAQNIRDLFAATGTQQRQNQNPFQQFFQRGRNQGNNNNQPAQAGAQRQPNDVSASANLRVTANTQQNAVTVVAEKPLMEQIRKMITEEWDIETTRITPRVYELKNTDPVKMRDVLITMFGNPGATQQRNNQQQSGTANRLYGQFTFEAIPDAARLVVIAKNEANLDEIDKIITQLDQPQRAGLPEIIELKHADAEQLAEQLNALLAREGTIAQVTKAQTGLTTSTTSASPFASTSSTQTTQQQQQQAQNAVWNMWWARSQPSTTTAGSGNLVGKIRIIPVWRQNSLMILSPPEYRDSLREVITTLDNPGRQVLLSAVIAEINVEDATALGLRWSNSAITPNHQDNAISFGPSSAGTTAGGTITGTKNDLLPGLFTSSVLNLGVNVNALIQALNEKTAVNILSEPRIFTSDNQQAEFFSGQDVPFITESQPNTQGNLVQSFDYRAVGIALRVRPRITINRDVDININLELSSIEPGQTLFGGFIVDRRETTTHLIIKDGQTVVVSGILRNEDSNTKRKIPILGDIPGIGAAFTSVEHTLTKTELIAFVTPYVIGNDVDIMRVDEQDKERLKEVRDKLVPVDSLDRPKNKSRTEPSPRGPGEESPKSTSPASPGSPPEAKDHQ